MAITAGQVSELRKRTGAGMMECKKALETTDGDIEKAIEAMRKAGQAKADKKADRTAAEGMIVLKQNAHASIMIEINSETDFVARDTHFKEFAETLATRALHEKVQDIAQLSELTFTDGVSVEEARKSLVAKLGENINIRRLVYVPITEGLIGAYVHSGRIGVLVHIKGEGDAALAKDLAMHIAANNPLVINSQDLPAELIEKEKDIYTAQAQESGKPADIVDKMIKSRLSKFMDEVSLLGQSFVKDPSIKIDNLLKSSKTEVVSFTRFVVGEGIEKKVGNFAEEVRAQVAGAA